MNGAATNPDLHVFAYAAAQVRKAIEITQKLGTFSITTLLYYLWLERPRYLTFILIRWRELRVLGWSRRLHVHSQYGHAQRAGSSRCVFEVGRRLQKQNRYGSKRGLSRNNTAITGFSGQLLIEPKPREPTKHQYDYGTLIIIDSP